MSGGWAALAALVPAPSGGGGLDAALDSPLGVLLRPLGDTPQEPRWHGEGDVLTHTRLVLEALEAAPEFWALDVERRAALWLAALLHDVGKAACTRLEGGAWTSPHHGQAGARLVRALLWREYGLAGEARGRGLRELVCTLIRHHAAPAHLFEAPHPERRLLRLAAQGELVPLFSLRLLKMLAEADARGRLAADRAEVLERLELGFLPAEELGILERPYAFASPRTELAYLRAGSPTPRRSFTTTAGARCCCSAVCRGQGRTPGCVPTRRGLRSSHRTRSAPSTGFRPPGRRRRSCAWPRSGRRPCSGSGYPSPGTPPAFRRACARGSWSSFHATVRGCA